MKKSAIRASVVIARLLLAIAVAAGGLIVWAAPAVADAPAAVELARTGACYLSSQDTDPSTGIAYLIVETTAGSVHQCELTVQDPSGATIADVTVTSGPAVVYLAAAGIYQTSLSDLAQSSEAIGNVQVTGHPVLPAAGPGAATAGGCTRSLEDRAIVGYLATYSTGWDATQTTGSSSCSSTVSTAGQAYTGVSSTNLTQIALVDPFGIALTKSVTLGGTVTATASVGDTVDYRFAVTNTGTVPWTVTINDPQHGLGTISCPMTSLAGGQTEVCIAPYRVTSADLASTPVRNTATATGVDRTRADATGASVSSAQATATLAITAGTPAPAPTHSAAAAGAAVNTGGTVVSAAGAEATGRSLFSRLNAPWAIVLAITGGVMLIGAAAPLLIRRRIRSAG